MTTITTTTDASRRPRLGEALAGVRRRQSMHATAGWLLVAGGVMVPLGALMILLGWYGASHTTRSWEQTPYLISGAVFGLFLALAGGFCYFGYWLSRMLATEREMLEVLRSMQAPPAAAAPVDQSPAATAAVEGPASSTFVATPAGSMFHRLDCQVVADRASADLRVVDPATKGLVPCKLCVAG
jgi:hypothetical protein